MSGRTARITAVLGLIIGASGIGWAAPASACACGGVANPPGGTVVSATETALLGWDGQRETIDMRIGLTGDTGKAALIIPTPAPATVTQGTPATFTELQHLTAPQQIVHKQWFPHAQLGFGAGLLIVAVTLNWRRVRARRSTGR
ncbi:DUF2330 domain-containing protein [Nocardia sp. NPDC020380]|uniref:DUF2330 domain-containing protein n=1 Tax=Nocardia sp. NPDC020380 TaxID=3364309 RepID=UPI00378AE131